MRPINVHAAKTHFSRLLARVERGETVVIARAGKPVAKLVPYVQKPGKRLLGQASGKVWIAPDFDAELPPEILAGFQGSAADDD